MIRMLEYNAAFIKELVEYQQLYFRSLLIRKKSDNFCFFTNRGKNVPNDDT